MNVLNVDNCKMILEMEKNTTSVNVSIIDDNGMIKKKTVSIEELASNLYTSCKPSTGLLPRGTRFYSGVSGDYYIGIEVPAVIRTIIYNQTGLDYKIPFPTCVITFNVKCGKIIKSKVYSLVRPIMIDTDYLYNFPFGNVYIDNGKICWGGVELKTIHSPFELILYVSAFFDSKYNGDLIKLDNFNSNIQCVKRGNLISLLEYLHERDSFPTEMLVKTRYKISDLIKQQIEN